MAGDVSRETFRAALDEGLDALSLFLPATVREKSVELYAILFEWNRVHNLTRICDAREVAQRHFIESWAPLTIPGLFDDIAAIADIGSGAGFPGLPLALARPDLSFTLVEKVTKKAAYLSFAAATLGLKNVSVRCTDARTLSDRFDLIAFRALTSDDQFIKDLSSLLSPGGQLLLFLGPSQAVPSDFTGEKREVVFSGRTLRFALLRAGDTPLR